MGQALAALRGGTMFPTWKGGERSWIPSVGAVRSRLVELMNVETGEGFGLGFAHPGPFKVLLLLAVFAA